MSADSVDEEANGPLALKLGNWSAMTSTGVVDDDCVMDLDVDLSLTWATVFDFRARLRSFVFSLCLLGYAVLCRFSFDRNPRCKFVKDVAFCTRSGNGSVPHRTPV